MKLVQTIIVEIPAYALGFLSETQVVVSGGGGSASSGVSNQFVLKIFFKKLY